MPKPFDAITYGPHSQEHWVYLIVPAALFEVDVFAVYIPAQRATRVDPLITRRYE